MNSREVALERFCERLCQGDEAALARAISLIDANLAAGSLIHRSVVSRAGGATVIGFTGPPGVGKSTLIDALVTQLRADGERVAVVAVDPSSPLSGGAVLGDRTRMGRHTDDPGVFIRSVSAQGHLGGLSMSILRILDLVDVAGWTTIVLETVGAGQSETEVADVADVSVVLNAPGLGDDVQAIKAGILEIADILVVNKSDLPNADATKRQLESMLKLRPENAQDIPVVCTTASEHKGITGLLAAIQNRSKEKFRGAPDERRCARTRSMLAQQLATQVKRQILHNDAPEVRELVESVSKGALEPEEALTYFLHSDGPGIPA